MDISEQTTSLRFGAIKTEASRTKAAKTFVQSNDPIVKDISTDVSDFRDKRHRVIFGNCLHKIPGGYALWTSQDSKVACGEDYIWHLPEACVVAAVRVGVCPGDAPAWAVEIRC